MKQSFQIIVWRPGELRAVLVRGSKAGFPMTKEALQRRIEEKQSLGTDYELEQQALSTLTENSREKSYVCQFGDEE